MAFQVHSTRGPDAEIPPLQVEEYEPRNAPPTMANPPFLCGMFGSRGAGKTTCMIDMLRWYDHYEAFDRIIIWSPTHEKDPKFEALARMKPNARLEMYDTFSHKHFAEVVEQMDRDVKGYDRYLEARKVYKKYRSHRCNEDKMTDEEILILYEYDFSDPVVFSDKYKKGRPSTLIVFDDQVGNRDVYRGDSTGPVGRFTLRHRHYNCSMCYLSQAYRNGIPKAMRANLSQAVFFANKSDKIKYEISEEMCSFVSPDQFVQMWNFATQEDHGCFFITFNAQRPEWRFRKNFDTIIVPGEDPDAAPPSPVRAPEGEDPQEETRPPDAPAKKRKTRARDAPQHFSSHR